MKINLVGPYATRGDVYSSIAIVLCIAAVIAGGEFKQPALAISGAVGSVLTAVYAFFTMPKQNKQ
jgi:hypothetical protein